MSKYHFGYLFLVLIAVVVPPLIGVVAARFTSSIRRAFFTGWFATIVAAVLMGIGAGIVGDLPIVLRGGHSPILGAPNIVEDSALLAFLNACIGVGSGLLSSTIAAVRIIRRNARS
jgi:hypothetical protein